MSLWVFEVRGGTYVAPLRPAERDVLADVVDQVVELLGGGDRAAVGDGRDDGRDDAGGRHDAGRDDEVTDDDSPAHPLDLVHLGAGPVPTPTDPAVHRLLPDGSRDDAEITAEFRRLTEGDLRSTKAGNLLRLRALLVGGLADRVAVPPGEAAAIAAAMTDLRLVVAERLGVHTEEEADDVYRLATAPGTDDGGEDPFRQLLAVVSVMLGVLQDSLVELMLDAMPDADDGPDTDDEPPDLTRPPR